MYVTDVAIDELVIDLPVSEDNVVLKMESMKDRGLVQPVTVWLEGMRIIDGFHRVVAAQRLGWLNIPCAVIDCSESAFWDARIQSARQHHEISNDRFRAWMLECWQSTSWHHTLSQEFGDTEDVSLAASLWDTVLWAFYAKDRHGNVYRLRHERYKSHKQRIQRNLGDDGLKMLAWIDTKAAVWDLSLADLTQIIFGSFAEADKCPDTHKVLNDYGQRHDWTLQERVGAAIMLGEPIPEQVIRRETDAHLDRFFSEAREGETIGAFKERFEADRQRAAERLRKQMDERAAEARQKLNAMRVRDLERAREEARQEALMPDRIQRQLTWRVDQLVSAVREHRDTIATLPQGYEIIMGLAEWCVQTCTDLWPEKDHRQVDTNPLALENIGLRKQLAREHGARVEAEATLLDKHERQAKLNEKLPDVMAWSEIQLPNS